MHRQAYIIYKKIGDAGYRSLTYYIAVMCVTRSRFQVLSNPSILKGSFTIIKKLKEGKTCNKIKQWENVAEFNGIATQLKRNDRILFTCH